MNETLKPQGEKKQSRQADSYALRELMPPGSRVIMTAEAIRQGLEDRKNLRTGIVSSWSNRCPPCINVRRDGEKTSTLYHPNFWCPLGKDVNIGN